MFRAVVFQFIDLELLKLPDSVQIRVCCNLIFLNLNLILEFGIAMYKVNQEQLEKESQSEAQVTKTTAEDEFLKRNTDCVYFLASPLTCKKGSECEYRHSEVARVNPRDCWFWLNGNCLNLKCGFRHPPLDGLLVTQKPTAVGHSFTPSQNTVTPAEQAFQVPAKQAVPCIFFQQGYCLKGDMCPFMHAPYSSNNKVSQLAAATPVTESQPNKKTFGGLQKSTQEQKDSHNKVQKTVELPVQANSVRKTDMAPLRDGIHLVEIGKSARRSNHNHQVDIQENQSVLNGRDVDEFSRDPSPGFDVLVDGEHGESDYYHNEDLFGGTRGHEGRNTKPLNDHELDRPDYHSMGDVDRDMYNDPRSYDSYDHRKGQYGQEHRVSSDRMLVGSARLERGRRSVADSTDHPDKSDLRHHLLKQKRGDGLRSVVTHDRVRDYHIDDRIYRPPQRDHMRARESELSSRLRGRIKIPGGSTSHSYKTGSLSERENDKGRHMGRLSPERLQGRLKERMKGRLYKDLDSEDRSIRSGSQIRHESKGNVNEDGVRFNGPKSLSELKFKKSGSYEQHVNDQQLLRKRKFPKIDGAPQQGEEGVSFEGPKPLSEILKKKKGVALVDNEKSAITSRNKEDDDHQEANKNLLMPIDANISNSVSSSLLKEEASLVEKNNENSKRASADIRGAEEKVKSTLGGQAALQSETEEGLIGDETMEDHEPEAYEQAEGYYDYEQADGEDYNLEEGENLDPEDEYYEEEDDADDFAKKMGVNFS